MSKHAMQHGARIVSMLGDDQEEYAWDGDDADEADPVERGDRGQDYEQPAAPMLSPDGAAAFDLGGCLDDLELDPVSSDFASLPAFIPQGDGVLFEKLKVQLKATYVSYLCASMPSTLLKQYAGGEIVGCLQFLLSELRKCLSQHSLEDVVDEEPTTLAEDLHARFPDDWLLHVLDPSALTLCGTKYDVPELIDTLQSLAQVCVDRLEENLGPIQSFVEASSPLRYIPPAEPFTVPIPEAAEADDYMSAADNYGDAPLSPGLAPTPWEQELAATVPLHHAPMHGMAATMGDFRHATASPAPRPGTGKAPTFDGTLGPAIWEQELTSGFPVTASGPHAMGMGQGRHATAAPGMRGIQTAAKAHPMTSYSRSAHPATSHGMPHPVGQYPTFAR